MVKVYAQFTLKYKLCLTLTVKKPKSIMHKNYWLSLCIVYAYSMHNLPMHNHWHTWFIHKPLRLGVFTHTLKWAISENSPFQVGKMKIFERASKTLIYLRVEIQISSVVSRFLFFFIFHWFWLCQSGVARRYCF